MRLGTEGDGAWGWAATPHRSSDGGRLRRREKGRPPTRRIPGSYRAAAAAALLTHGGRGLAVTTVACAPATRLAGAHCRGPVAPHAAQPPPPRARLARGGGRSRRSRPRGPSRVPGRLMAHPVRGQRPPAPGRVRGRAFATGARTRPAITVIPGLDRALPLGVPKGGLEPPRVAPPPPQDGVSTKFHHFGMMYDDLKRFYAPCREAYPRCTPIGLPLLLGIFCPFALRSRCPACPGALGCARCTGRHLLASRWCRCRGRYRLWCGLRQDD
jgi:hypothetical protein